MALFDSADLLARCRDLADRPAADEQMDDPRWYRHLSTAQSYWLEQFATQVPEANVRAPERLETTDGGFTYQFAAEPVGVVEIREARNGRILHPGPEWESRTGYVPDGAQIRWPDGRARIFADGPYARYTAAAGGIDAQSQPVLMPARARILLVYRACILYATQGGQLDPSPYYNQEKEAWTGRDDDAADSGILASLKKQYQGSYGAGGGRSWWHSPDLG